MVSDKRLYAVNATSKKLLESLLLDVKFELKFRSLAIFLERGLYCASNCSINPVSYQKSSRFLFCMKEY